MIAKKLPLESKRARNEGRGQKQTRVRGVGSKDEEKTGGKGNGKTGPGWTRHCAGRALCGQTPARSYLSTCNRLQHYILEGCHRCHRAHVAEQSIASESFPIRVSIAQRSKKRSSPHPIPRAVRPLIAAYAGMISLLTTSSGNPPE